MNHDLFSHFTRIDKVLRKYIRKAVEEYDFTENEVLIMTVLTNQKHITTASQISRLRSISKGLVAKSVDSLTMKGYLFQEQDQEDKRIFHLSFTEKGLILSNKLRQATLQFTEELNAGITEQHKQAMIEMMEIMTMNINKMEENHE